MNKIVLLLVVVTAISGVAVLSNNIFSIGLQPYQVFNSFDEFTDPICTCQGFDDEGHLEYSQENCQGFSNGFTDPNMLCTSVVGTTGYGSPGIVNSAQGCGAEYWKNNQVSNIASAESGKTVIWPDGYQANYYFNDMFHTTLSHSQKNLDVENSKVSKNDEAKDNDEVLSAEAEDKEALDDVEEKAEKDEIKDNDEVLSAEEDEETLSDVKEKAEKDEIKDKGPTLLEALNSQGEGKNSLLRHSVAAMLNAAHPDINYPLSVIQVIELTQISIINEDYQKTTEMFERYNEELQKPSMCLE